MDEVIVIISDIGIAVLGINTLIYFTGFTKNGKAYKFLCLYLLSSCIIQIIMQILAFKGLNNHFLSGYYLFSQFILLSYFFYQIFLPLNKTKSSVIKYLSLTIIAGLVIQYLITPNLYFNFNPLGLLITSLVLIIYAVLYLFELLTHKLVFSYIAIGVFIYLVSSSVIFASSVTTLTLSYDTFILIWHINGILFILYQLLILWEWKQHFLPKKIK